ncbi:MAG: TrkA C-terminal domain-containing protein [Desulfobacterales bacterium]
MQASPSKGACGGACHRHDNVFLTPDGKTAEPHYFHCGPVQNSKAANPSFWPPAPTDGNPLMISARSAWLSGCCGRPGHHVSGSGVRLQPKRHSDGRNSGGSGLPLVNVMLKDSGIRQKFNLIIIAIKKPNDEMLFNPSFETVINSGDTVIAMGKTEGLVELEKILRPGTGKQAGHESG